MSSWAKSSSRLLPAVSLLAACVSRTGGAGEGGTTSSTGTTTTASTSTSTTTEVGSESDTGGESTGTPAETETETETGLETETETGTVEDCYEQACVGSTEDFCFPCAAEDDESEPSVTLGGPSGFTEGGVATMICNDCYSWVFVIEPQFGGFELTSKSVQVEYEVRVEDFNIQDGLFDSGQKGVSQLCCDVQNELGACPPWYGYVAYDCDEVLDLYVPDDSFIFQPPQDIPDLAALDGQAIELTLRFTAGGEGMQEFVFNGTVEAAGAAWDDCPVLCDVVDPEFEPWVEPLPIPDEAGPLRLAPPTR